MQGDKSRHELSRRASLDHSVRLSWSCGVLRALVQEFGDLKQRSIGVFRCLPSKLIEGRGLKQALNGASNCFEAGHDDPVTLLGHPFRVVALLRQGSGIAFHDDGQVELQRLADRARTWFPNKEVGHGDVVFDILSESNDEDWLSGLELLELSGELLVVAANQD